MRIAAALLLCALPTSQGAPVFVEVDAGLSGVQGFEVNWGDYDGDGDLDLALEGIESGARFTRLYRQDAGTFVHESNAMMLGLNEGPFIFGDYDRDGDLDIAFGGWSGGGTGNRIHRNDGGGVFTDIVAPLRGMKGADGAWLDYDNDGDLDLLLAGESFDPPQGDYAQIYRNDGGDAFVHAVDFTGMYVGAVSAGDFDRDGDVDVAICGRTAGLKIYRNDGGTFAEHFSLPGDWMNSCVAWGDVDNDGDLDFYLSGDNQGALKADLYLNDNGAFVAQNAGLPAVRLGDADWGDYDNDGDLDLLLVGWDDAMTPLALVRRNQGGGVFVDAALALTGVADQSTAAWGDYDKDGDLDIVLAGTEAGGTYVVKVYRNDAPTANTAPAAPSNPRASWNGKNLTIQWDAAADGQTPPDGMTYNLRVGTSPGGQEIMAAMSDVASGFRRVPAAGNARQNLAWTLKNLSPGTYYFSVQAVDSGYLGSAWSAEASIASPPVGLRVTNVSPTGVMTAGISEVRVTLDAPPDPASVSSTSFSLSAAGPDGLLGGADDALAHPKSTSIQGNDLVLDFAGVPLPNGPYRIRVRGDAPAVADEIHRWSLDEGAGSTAADAVGGLNGTLGGAATPTWTASGRLGGALEFAGADGRVVLGAGDLAGPWTASLWVFRVDSPAEDARLMDSPGASFRLEQFNHTNQVGFTMPGQDFAFNYTAPPGAWTHLTFAYDTTILTLYVNGEKVQSVGVAGLGCPRDALGSSGFNALHGRLDEIRIFSRRLQEREIRALAGLGGALRALNGALLDGDYTGTFPSGDGFGGGDFVFDFSIEYPRPFIAFATPVPGSAGAAPLELSAAASVNLDPATVTLASVRVVRAGLDGALGTGDDVVVTPTSVALDSQIVIRVFLPPGLPADTYRATLSGVAADPPGALNVWRFDEGLGAVAFDAAGGLDGTLGGTGGGTPLRTVGRLGGGLLFHGVKDRVSLGGAGVPAPWSAAMWARRDLASAEDGRLIDSPSFSLRLEQFDFTRQVGVTIAGVSDGAFAYAAPQGAWAHLTFVGENDGTSLYVDGVFSQKLPLVLDAPRNSFGSDSYNSMAGVLDEARVYGRVLGAAEIRTLASGGGAIRSAAGEILDGEFGGSFPSGNGVPGGDFSWTFTIVNPPGDFTLTAPAGAATGVSLTPVFTWTASSDAASYRLRVSADPLFGSFVIDQAGIAATMFTPAAPLAPGTTYYWDVQAINPAGSRFGVGSISSFTTGGPPGAFALVSPAPGASGLVLSPTFQWTAATGASEYRLQVSTDPAFASFVIDQAGIAGTSTTPFSALAASTTYHWRVVASNGAGTSMAGPSSFSTGAAPGFRDVRLGGDCGLTGAELFLLLALARRLKAKARR